MGSERDRNRAFRILWESAGRTSSWFFGTKTFKAMFGEGGGSEGVNETFAHRSMDGFGAFILGRNMFGPVRGNGWTTAGRAGGETIRPITLRRSS
jgi:hypothetical protein